MPSGRLGGYRHYPNPWLRLVASVCHADGIRDHNHLPAEFYPSARKETKMRDVDRKFATGSIVKVRQGGFLEMERYHKRDVEGRVVEAQEIPGYGYGIKVQWPGEAVPWSFQLADFFDPAD